jgi:putative dehydrogenase
MTPLLDERVGIIGVGALGLAVAERLIAAGFAVSGFRRGSLDGFAAAGGRPMPSAQALVREADIVILLLPNDDGLAEVMDNITPSLKRGHVLLCLGTHALQRKQEAAKVAQAAGAVLLDGEVSGTPAMVRSGRASVMLAGDPEIAERVQPILSAFARATKRLAAFGDATRMKLVTNYLVGVHTLAAAEALHLGQCLGLDARSVVEAIAPSAGGSTMLSVRGTMMVEGNFDGGGMAGFMRFFELLRAALGNSSEASWPLMSLTEQLYHDAIDQGYGENDIAAIYKSLRATP